MHENIPSQSIMTELLGQTLCSLYAKSNCVGFMIIFGKDERTKFEDIRSTLSDDVCRQYDEAKTYRDGKWVMFEPTNTADLAVILKTKEQLEIASKENPFDEVYDFYRIHLVFTNDRIDKEKLAVLENTAFEGLVAVDLSFWWRLCPV